VKLLVINPNITESVTRLIGEEAKRAASPGTELTLLTAPFGVAYIETRLEAVIGAYASLLLMAENLGKHDAVIIAAFGDPGLPALRDAIDRPVIGLTDAALIAAGELGNRFSIIAISQRITAWYRETVDHYKMGERLASIRALDQPIRDIGGVQDEHAARLKALCTAAIDEVPVPLVDPIASAVRLAETTRAGIFTPPPQKANAGLPEPLQRLFRSL
jgi:allantoin racemase